MDLCTCVCGLMSKWVDLCRCMYCIIFDGWMCGFVCVYVIDK